MNLTMQIDPATRTVRLKEVSTLASGETYELTLDGVRGANFASLSAALYRDASMKQKVAELPAGSFAQDGNHLDRAAALEPFDTSMTPMADWFAYATSKDPAVPVAGVSTHRPAIDPLSARERQVRTDGWLVVSDVSRVWVACRVPIVLLDFLGTGPLPGDSLSSLVSAAVSGALSGKVDKIQPGTTLDTVLLLGEGGALVDSGVTLSALATAAALTAHVGDDTRHVTVASKTEWDKASTALQPSSVFDSSTGLIKSNLLPSYVDDVLEFDSRSGFPSSGETGKIYVAKDTSLAYRWTGSVYVLLSSPMELGTQAGQAYPGPSGHQLADAVQALAGDVTSLSSDLTSLSSTVTSVSNTATSAAATLQTLSGTVSGLSTNLQTLSGTVSGLSTGLQTLSGTVQNLPMPVQSDWDEEDPTSLAYIRNRPGLAASLRPESPAAPGGVVQLHDSTAAEVVLDALVWSQWTLSAVSGLGFGQPVYDASQWISASAYGNAVASGDEDSGTLSFTWTQSRVLELVEVDSSSWTLTDTVTGETLTVARTSGQDALSEVPDADGDWAPATVALSASSSEPGDRRTYVRSGTFQAVRSRVPAVSSVALPAPRASGTSRDVVLSVKGTPSSPVSLVDGADTVETLTGPAVYRVVDFPSGPKALRFAPDEKRLAYVLPVVSGGEAILQDFAVNVVQVTPAVTSYGPWTTTEPLLASAEPRWTGGQWKLYYGSDVVASANGSESDTEVHFPAGFMSGSDTFVYAGVDLGAGTIQWSTIPDGNVVQTRLVSADSYFGGEDMYPGEYVMPDFGSDVTPSVLGASWVDVTNQMVDSAYFQPDAELSMPWTVQTPAATFTREPPRAQSPEAVRLPPAGSQLRDFYVTVAGSDAVQVRTSDTLSPVTTSLAPHAIARFTEVSPGLLRVTYSPDPADTVLYQVMSAWSYSPAGGAVVEWDDDGAGGAGWYILGFSRFDGSSPLSIDRYATSLSYSDPGTGETVTATRTVTGYQLGLNGGVNSGKLLQPALSSAKLAEWDGKVSRTGDVMTGHLFVPTLTVGSEPDAGTAGLYSTRFGYKSVARGYGSVAGGSSSSAGGPHSFAFGTAAQALNEAENAQGSYNKSHSADASSFGNPGNTLSSIGFGTSSATRKNVIEVMQDGKTYVYGVGDYDGTNPGAEGVSDVASVVQTLKTPTAHAASHAMGGGDAITPADIGAASFADLPYALVTPVPSPSGGVNLIDRGSNYIAVDASGYTQWMQYAGDSGFTTPEWDSSLLTWKSTSPWGNTISAASGPYSGNETLLSFVDQGQETVEPFTLDSYERDPGAAPGELSGDAIMHNSYGTFSVRFVDYASYIGDPSVTYGQACFVKISDASSPGGTYLGNDIYVAAQDFVAGLVFSSAEDAFFCPVVQATFTRSALGSTAIALPAPVNGKARDLLLLLDIAAGATVSGLSFAPGTGKTWVADGGSFPTPEAGKLNLYSFTDLPTGRVLVSRRVVEDVSAGGGS